MVPLKPLRLANLTVEVPHEPGGMVRLAGPALMEKSDKGALLMNVATWTVSGTGIVDPFATVTHTRPLTLALLQPVCNPRAISEVVRVTLYMAVNNISIVCVAVM